MSLGRVCQNDHEPWYLVQLKPGGFERAVTNLARQGYESFMPLREETRRRAGHWDTRLRPLFPGYLFVKVPDNRQQWRSINATYGVSRLIALEAGRPTQIPPGLVAALQVGCGEDGKQQPPAGLQIGDEVRVVSGPFTDKLAAIESLPERGRIYVLLELMGCYTKAVLSVSDVERAVPRAS